MSQRRPKDRSHWGTEITREVLHKALQEDPPKRLPGLYPKIYPLLEECIEAGLKGGFWNELPESWPEIDQARVEDLTEKFAHRILNEICERFDFD